MIQEKSDTPYINLADIADSIKGKGHPFIGTTIVVTGKLKYFTRRAIHAKIESLGAKAKRTVSKNTDYLIYGEKAGSKLDKALALGVKILTEKEFLLMTENKGGCILEQMQDASALPRLTRTEQADGTVCYFFGNTCIRVRESCQEGKLHLEPLAGDQAACGEWVDLEIDRVRGYCNLLERHLSQGKESENVQGES